MLLKKINYIDLFAGCGGLSDGFESTGLYNGLAHIDWDLPSLNTLKNRLIKKYKKNDHNCIHFDIQETGRLFDGFKNDRKYGSYNGLNETVNANKVKLIIGGPPCQAYSLAGRVRDVDGMRNDYRNYLFESYIKVLKKINPEIFIFENVPGMLSASPGGYPIVNRIRKAFDYAGYTLIDDFKKALFDLSNFGVPQSRKRVILIGLSKKKFKKNREKLIEGFYKKFVEEHHVTVKKSSQEALKNLPKIVPVENPEPRKSHKILKKTNVKNHIPRFHNSRDVDIFKILTKDIQSKRNKYLSADALKKLYTEKTGKISSVHKYYVIRPNKPSNTIPSHLYKDGLRHIHWDPNQARSITVREAARLQTFDDSYEFIGSLGDQYKMIGNAVPPLFSKLIAQSLKKYFMIS